MPAVSNTSPILNLAIIGHLDLLQRQFDEIWIPQAVEQELRIEEELPGSAAVHAAMKAGWLQTRSIENLPFFEVLARELDRGEAEAIVLAVETRANRILLDEREARRVATTLHLPVTGVLGILLRAYQSGQLASPLPELLNALRVEAGFRLADALVNQILQETQ
jgi:predicted nucleic acid-binding protein